MIVLLLKVTVLVAAALCALPLLRRSTSAMRHLICAIALSGVLLLPLTLAFKPHTIAVRMPVVFTTAASLSTSAAAHRFPTLAVFWALGTSVLLLRLALGYRRLAKIMGTAERTTDFAPVYRADEISVPVVSGLFRPVILLPAEADSWPLNQRVAALRHELAHIHRKDLWTSLIAHLACAVYWFHPLVWAVARQLREEQETACDDAVLSAGFEPANYAEALLATARQLTSTSLIGCHMLTHQTLKSRIARLLDGSLPRTSSTTSLRLAGVLSIALLGCIGLTYAEQQAPAANEGKVYKIGGEVTAPHVIFKVDPQYTEEARAAKIDGQVTLSVVIGADGMAHQINVTSTPDAGLGTKAVEAVEQWKFQPATLKGEAVPVKATIEVNFKIK